MSNDPYVTYPEFVNFNCPKCGNTTDVEWNKSDDTQWCKVCEARMCETIYDREPEYDGESA